MLSLQQENYGATENFSPKMIAVKTRLASEQEFCDDPSTVKCLTWEGVGQCNCEAADVTPGRHKFWKFIATAATSSGNSVFNTRKYTRHAAFGPSVPVCRYCDQPQHPFDCQEEVWIFHRGFLQTALKLKSEIRHMWKSILSCSSVLAIIQRALAKCAQNLLILTTGKQQVAYFFSNKLASSKLC